MRESKNDQVIDLRADTERDRMVAAAWAVLERSGWDGLKVERVLVEAGLSTRSFYRHFYNKNHLLAVMLETDIEMLGEMLDESLGQWDEPVDQVVAWMTDLMNLASVTRGYKHSRFFMTNWFMLAVEFPDAVERCKDRIEGPLAAVIEEGTRRGDFSSVDPRLDAHLIRGLAMEFLAGVLTKAEADMDFGELDGAVRFALHALCGRLEADLVGQMPPRTAAGELG